MARIAVTCYGINMLRLTPCLWYHEARSLLVSSILATGDGSVRGVVEFVHLEMGSLPLVGSRPDAANSCVWNGDLCREDNT